MPSEEYTAHLSVFLDTTWAKLLRIFLERKFSFVTAEDYVHFGLRKVVLICDWSHLYR